MEHNDYFRSVTAVRKICNLSAVHSYRYQHAGILINSAANTARHRRVKTCRCDLCAILRRPVHGSPVWGIGPALLVHVGGQLHLPGTVPLPSCISPCSLCCFHMLGREQCKLTCNKVLHLHDLSAEAHFSSKQAVGATATCGMPHTKL